MKTEELKKKLVEILNEKELITGKNPVFDKKGVVDENGKFLDWRALMKFETPLEAPSEEYFGFKTNKTGDSYDKLIKNPLYNFFCHEQEAEIIEMPPEEYFIKMAPGATLTELFSFVDKKTAGKYAEKMKSGDKFPIPYLVYFANTIGQEGKHRAYAARLLNIKKIPVLFVKNNEVIFRVFE